MRLLAHVSVSGDAVTPLIMMTAPIRDTLWSRGLKQDENTMIRESSPASIAGELFYDYISTVFIPCILAVRDMAGLENKKLLTSSKGAAAPIGGVASKRLPERQVRSNRGCSDH
jgi:hypothetical protein